ncbi:hypothetical protein B0H11DRAFT_1915627 [Mycena galericulata]|nr:hypothetical protein B0H11DRAFT_1915627 [Mycena galericulata]
MLSFCARRQRRVGWPLRGLGSCSGRDARAITGWQKYNESPSRNLSELEARMHLRLILKYPVLDPVRQDPVTAGASPADHQGSIPLTDAKNFAEAVGGSVCPELRQWGTNCMEDVTESPNSTQLRYVGAGGRPSQAAHGTSSGQRTRTSCPKENRQKGISNILRRWSLSRYGKYHPSEYRLGREALRFGLNDVPDSPSSKAMPQVEAKDRDMQKINQGNLRISSCSAHLGKRDILSKAS